MLLPLALMLFALVTDPPDTVVPQGPTLVEAVSTTYPHSRFGNPDRTVVVALVVNTDGLPEKVHVVQTGGERFDKNAVATVQQYRFKPATRAGQAVAQEIRIEVNYKAGK